ncbi:phage-related integrase/recombinase [Candidatus Liberibacter solanacearum CLso-ZC1]|uniref:Phage-related integrase/recombinase n=2 Tax=Candidatus Liberibacter solanacearum TaxID=556287 RepID=E4UCB4_LIBSC|nr:hypothetical protein [Candidatus Liberibacter solanacearum]ADR52004.1 phage-related integrase/recombinase [Candidatus Liberibacter solanacearum CLso-ZC1]
MKILEITPTGRETFILKREKEKMNAFQFSLWLKEKDKKAGIKKSAHGVRKLSATLFKLKRELQLTSSWPDMVGKLYLKQRYILKEQTEYDWELKILAL